MSVILKVPRAVGLELLQAGQASMPLRARADPTTVKAVMEWVGFTADFITVAVGVSGLGALVRTLVNRRPRHSASPRLRVTNAAGVTLELYGDYGEQPVDVVAIEEAVRVHLGVSDSSDGA